MWHIMTSKKYLEVLVELWLIFVIVINSGESSLIFFIIYGKDIHFKNIRDRKELMIPHTPL